MPLGEGARVVKPRSPEVLVWEQSIAEAMDAAVEHEIERVCALTAEECERELRAAGFDVEAEKARAEEWLKQLERGEVP
jgi:hypothetical protein